MESRIIKRLRALPGSHLIGDDAAVIGSTVVTVDMLTEGVDFILAETDPKQIGRKALAVNLSDIAAMGAVPVWIFIAVALPKKTNLPGGGLELAEKLFAGAKPLIDKYHLILAGGDTNTWDGGLVISVTVIGKITKRGVFRRSGGKKGDRILVTGKLGGSILQHQFLFEPRVDEALFLNTHYKIHSAIDISDGLSLDLHRLAAESHLGAVLIESSVPIADDAVKLSKQTGKTPLEHALADGEDFELLFTTSPPEAKKLLTAQPFRRMSGVTLYDIGELIAEKGLYIAADDGRIRELPPKGFVHR
jgi:thiamine-monophosphate kinase